MQPEPWPFYAGKQKPPECLPIAADFHAWPIRKFLFDNTNPVTDEARRFSAEFEKQSFTAGEVTPS